ncbi:NAD-dependent epimerase/dehydratase family protein [Nocardia transvalensis]|uniref:NAD-dependent epimerase/dehydratase family protein n=1 Tax=Nocardia transvalensis TaxID=37333 RepID=UPI0018941515|nr:NAD-dependent epimerase/dehydratase [Nocardia transvalensis]MBF6329814.1 NAD-dependent epimerase/dehydratase [Nocardia transvalensis]
MTEPISSIIYCYMRRVGCGRPLIVVLGASGFLGSAIVRTLESWPVNVRAVTRRAGWSCTGGGSAEVEVHRACLTVPGELAAAVTGADVVINLVAHISPASSWRIATDDPAAERVNVGVMRELVEVLRAENRIRRPVVLYSGTISQVGIPPSIRIDGSEVDNPVTTYDRQKLAAERILKKATAEGVVRGITLRLPTVFGPSPDSGAKAHGVVATMVRCALEGKPLPLWNDGTVLRDMVYVDDAARAFVAALDHVDRLVGEHWLIGTGEPIRVSDLLVTIAETVAVVTGCPPVPVVSVTPERAEATDSKSFVIDSSAFRAVTGWSASISTRHALEYTVKALVAQLARS